MSRSSTETSLHRYIQFMLSIFCTWLLIPWHMTISRSVFEKYVKPHISNPSSMLQTSQRDILQAFSFSLGGHNTPQSYLDEVWLALPTLRTLLNFKDGWKDAQRETWKGLFGIILGVPSFFVSRNLSLINLCRARHPLFPGPTPHCLRSNLWNNHLSHQPLRS